EKARHRTRRRESPAAEKYSREGVMRRAQFLAVLTIATTPAFAGNDNHGKDDQPGTYCVFELGQLPGLPPGEVSLDVAGINERDQIVGSISVVGVDATHAFI